MNISTETREILRNYRAVINARRREMGQKPLTNCLLYTSPSPRDS